MITWLVLQRSLNLFFSCSLWTISSSFLTLASLKSGQTKKEANLRSASSKCSEGMSK